MLMLSRRKSSRPVLAALTCVALAVAVCPQVAEAANQPAEGPDQATMAKAKKLFMEGEKAFAKEDFATAANKYEEAYYLLPDKHGFAYKVGISAWKSGDCPRAYQYFRHFVQYETDTEGKAGQLDEAKTILGEIAVQECAGAAAQPAADPGAPVTGDEPDLSADPEQLGAEDEEEGEKEKKDNGLLIGGVAALVVGVAGIGLGVGTRVVAVRNADELTDRASRGTPTGYAAGQYDATARDLEASLPKLSGASIAGFTLGGVGLAVGGTLIALHFVKRGKKDAAEPEPEAQHRPQQLMVAPSFGRSGGGASFSMRF